MRAVSRVLSAPRTAYMHMVPMFLAMALGSTVSGGGWIGEIVAEHQHVPVAVIDGAVHHLVLAVDAEAFGDAEEADLAGLAQVQSAPAPAR